jgi:hypothetical protein
MQNHKWINAAFGALIAFATVSADAASEKSCRIYAQRAIQQYNIMTNRSKCHIKTSPRWQVSYQNHYGWCLTAPTAWLRTEEKARDAHLYRCGGQTLIDNG